MLREAEGATSVLTEITATLPSVGAHSESRLALGLSGEPRLLRWCPRAWVLLKLGMSRPCCVEMDREVRQRRLRSQLLESSGQTAENSPLGETESCHPVALLPRMAVDLLSVQTGEWSWWHVGQRPGSFTAFSG